MAMAMTMAVTRQLLKLTVVTTSIPPIHTINNSIEKNQPSTLIVSTTFI